ncbi:NAD(P)/FAD-dependent oxidoreductase [Portibacter lacus]|nr:FAD-dependent oxidoreductase [Portibacter lacus]
MKSQEVCAIIGASHAGVNCAFALRKEGWKGKIIMYDGDPELPYHRPPLSKAYLSAGDIMGLTPLKSEAAYLKEDIVLRLGTRINAIHPKRKEIILENGDSQAYHKLVIATGARPIIPRIPGIETATHLYPLRTAAHVNCIQEAIKSGAGKEVVIIGGGYIGLETAASLKKLGANVKVLEREERILARVTAPVMSDFFHQLHTENDVEVLTGKNVVSIESNGNQNTVTCEDGSHYIADLIIVGVGIKVNVEMAEKAGIKIKNGILVDNSARTNDKDIYAIGDCTYHFNTYYDRFVRLESVQNAVDQAKIAAAAICGKEAGYNAIPWFWSDQFDVKLQMVGLSEGYDEVIIRKENTDNCFSLWYFIGDDLLSVDAVNNAKAYVWGTKFLKSRVPIDKEKLKDSTVDLKAIPKV